MLKAAAEVGDRTKKNPLHGYRFLAGGNFPARTRDPYGLHNPWNSLVPVVERETMGER
jgi:hypothetical protein